VSIGVATYEPSDSIDLDLLIDRADRAQYMAKHTGKNRVVAWNTVHTMPSKIPNNQAT
jgi:PleD family two-component response regulator